MNAYAGVMGSCCLVTVTFLPFPFTTLKVLVSRVIGRTPLSCGWKLQFVELSLCGTDFFLSIENYFDHMALGSVGDIQICQDVDGHHNFHPDCDVHLISKSCMFLTILPPPCLGFGCNCEFLF